MIDYAFHLIRGAATDGDRRARHAARVAYTIEQSAWLRRRLQKIDLVQREQTVQSTEPLLNGDGAKGVLEDLVGHAVRKLKAQLNDGRFETDRIEVGRGRCFHRLWFEPSVSHSSEREKEMMMISEQHGKSFSVRLTNSLLV